MVKAYVFDAYGTLFDVHSAVRHHAARIGKAAGQLSEIWRTKQLEYTWVLTLAGAYEDFETVTAHALDFAMLKCDIGDAALRDALLKAYDHVDAYDEVKPVLTRLRGGGAKLAVLSNGTERMLHLAIDHAGLNGAFDAVYSVDTIKRFKTDQNTYALARNGLGLMSDEISFQSSNRWDIAGARRFGFQTAWINRTGQPDEYPTLKPHKILKNLNELGS